MTDDAFRICKKVICILDRTNPDFIGIHGCIVDDFLCLGSCLSNNLICLCISLLHDLMLTDQFGGLYLCFFNHSICFCFCICQNRIPVRDDLLITLDLIRSLHAKLTEQLIHMLFIYNDLGLGQGLKFTVSVNIFFNLFNDLFNAATHQLHSPFSFIFFSSSTATACGTN